MAPIELTPEQYPVNLREIYDPPERLWLRGSLPPPETKMLTVVGSRALSKYGRESCEMLIEGLRGYPISVVSGLALGADACAHRAALSAGLHTIAIPGSGLDNEVIGPRSNLGLAKDILNKGGALLSENEPNHMAEPWDFPSRNRIMAGLGDAVLIIEAGRKSGTLITCKFAGEYNRELLCLPHRIGDSHGFGAEIFLREGATYVTHPHHILEALHIPVREETANAVPELSAEEQRVYDLLDEPRTRDELIRQGNLPSHRMLTLLMALELRGILQEQFGIWKRL